MDSLIDSLDPEVWVEKNSNEIPDFTEYQIMRHHQQIDDHTIRYLIQTSQDADPGTATCTSVLKGKDPIKNIGTCELKVDPDGNVIAINLNGDCVVKKC